MKLLKPLALAGLGLSVSISSFAELEEIIVTATKREASVQEIPIAITAVSGEQISKAGINDIRDLSALSSSFQANSSNSESGGTTLRVRGIGTTGNNAGLESAVGVFIDGVYLSRPGIALGDLVDVERVEVLRGPQGTLFGRNTSAGALNIITKKASLNESEFWANASFGNYDARNFQLGGTFALIEDELGFRFSGSKRDQDGFAESLTSGTESVTRDRYSLRGELLWAPNDAMELRFIGDYAETDEQCCDGAVLVDTPLLALGAYAAAGFPGGAGILASGGDAFDDRDTNGGGLSTETEQWGISAQLDWDLGWADLTTVLSYREYESMGANDSDFSGLDVFSIGTSATNGFPDIDGRNENETWSAEIRLQGSTDRLDWMVGAYYSDEDIDIIAPFQVGEDYLDFIAATTVVPALAGAAAVPGFVANNAATVIATGAGSPDVTVGDLLGMIGTRGIGDALFGVNTPVAGRGNIDTFKQQASSYSFYTHNTFAINEQLDLVFGLRWINEEKDGQVEQIFSNGSSCFGGQQRMGALLGNVAELGAALGGLVSLGCFFPIAPTTTPSPLLRTSTSDFDSEFHDEELTYTAKLVYQIDDQSSTYVSYTHGFKAGGFNLDVTAATGGADPRFDSETTDAWEVGYKADLYDNRLRANVAVFYQELEDFQVLEFTGIQFKTFNVPKVLSSGIETEFLLSAFDDLDLSLALTYSDARYPNSCNNGVVDGVVSRLCGADLTNAPEIVGVLGANYNTEIPGTELSFFATGSIRYESERRTSTQAVNGDGNDAVKDIQSGHSKMNLRLGVVSVDGKWTVELWGNNLTDKQTRNVTFNVPLRGASDPLKARAAFFDAPRTYGLTVRAQF